MTIELTQVQRNIVERVFKGRDPSFWIAAIQAQNLNFDEIEEVCDLLSGEFLMNGIDRNFEANNYGKEVQDLMDIVNRPRISN